MSPLLLLRDLPSLLTPSPSLLDARRPRALLPLALLPFLTGDLPRAPTAVAPDQQLLFNDFFWASAFGGYSVSTSVLITSP